MGTPVPDARPPPPDALFPGRSDVDTRLEEETEGGPRHRTRTSTEIPANLLTRRAGSRRCTRYLGRTSCTTTAGRGRRRKSRNTTTASGSRSRTGSTRPCPSTQRPEGTTPSVGDGRHWCRATNGGGWDGRLAGDSWDRPPTGCVFPPFF